MQGDTLLMALALCATTQLTVGCTSSIVPQNYTTISLRNGTVLHGDIVRANAADHSILFELAPDWTVNVMGIPVGPDGDRLLIATDDVLEIEHAPPWKLPVYWTLVAVGSALMTGGGAMMLLADDDDESATGPILLATGGVAALTGLIYAVATHVHISSSEALWDEAVGPRSSPGVVPAPPPSAAGGVGGQLTVSWTFEGL